MTSAAERLRLLRRAHGQRGDRRSPTDVAYHLYLALLSLPLVAAPVVRAVALALATPSVLTGLRAPTAVDVVGLVLGLALAGLAWLGIVFGPVSVEPAFVRLLADTDLPRHRTLARPFATTAAAAVAVLVAAAVLLSGVLVAAGAATPAAGARFAGLCAVFAVIGAVVWLAGQAVAPRLAGVLGAVLAAVAVLGWLVPGARVAMSWHWVAAAWPAAPAPGAGGTVLLLAAGAVACGCARPLLDLLRSTRLTDDATRWRAAAAAAVTGDVALALGGLRARPSTGRRWRAVRAAPEPLRSLIQDVVGAARTPVRSLVGVLALASAAVLLALATTLPAGWVLAAVGAALAYLALGVLSDGFRHATEAAVAPPLYGCSVRTLFARHATAPLVVVSAVTGGGLAAMAALGIGFRALPVAVVVLLVVLVRAYDSAKGPLPVALLTPVASPVGDLSSLNVSIWEADALIVAALTGAAAVSLAPGSPVRLVVLAAALAGLLALGLRRRLRRL